MATIHELIRDHVSLEVECLDRLYLNGYVPELQMPGQLVNFLVQHRGNKIPSPALLGHLTKGFREAVEDFAQAQGVPLVHFKASERKEDVAAKYRAAFKEREGVVFIGIAQEKAQAFKATEPAGAGFASFDFSRQSVWVIHYYFYLQDAEFGPAFIKPIFRTWRGVPCGRARIHGRDSMFREDSLDGV